MKNKTNSLSGCDAYYITSLPVRCAPTPTVTGTTDEDNTCNEMCALALCRLHVDTTPFHTELDTALLVCWHWKQSHWHRIEIVSVRTMYSTALVYLLVGDGSLLKHHGKSTMNPSWSHRHNPDIRDDLNGTPPTVASPSLQRSCYGGGYGTKRIDCFLSAARCDPTNTSEDHNFRNISDAARTPLCQLLRSHSMILTHL